MSPPTRGFTGNELLPFVVQVLDRANNTVDDQLIVNAVNLSFSAPLPFVSWGSLSQLCNSSVATFSHVVLRPAARYTATFALKEYSTGRIIQANASLTVTQTPVSFVWLNVPSSVGQAFLPLQSQDSAVYSRSPLQQQQQSSSKTTLALVLLDSAGDTIIDDVYTAQVSLKNNGADVAAVGLVGGSERQMREGMFQFVDLTVNKSRQVRASSFSLSLCLCVSVTFWVCT